MKIKTTPIILLIAFASTAQAKLDFSLGFVNLKSSKNAIWLLEGSRINRGVEFDVVINKYYHLQPSIFISEYNDKFSLAGNFIFNYTIVNYAFTSRVNWQNNNIHLQSGVGFITKNSFLDFSGDLNLYYLKFPLSLLINHGIFRLGMAPYFAVLLYHDSSNIEDIDNFDYGMNFECGFNLTPIFISLFGDISSKDTNYIKKEEYNRKSSFRNYEAGFNIGVNFL